MILAGGFLGKVSIQPHSENRALGSRRGLHLWEQDPHGAIGEVGMLKLPGLHLGLLWCVAA